MDELDQLIAELKKAGRACERCEADWGQSFLVFKSKGRFDANDETKIFLCDTAMFIKVENPNRSYRSKHAIFSTFICEDLFGDSLQKFYNIFNYFNYKSLGKFVQDYIDGSNDILYVTSEFMNRQLTCDIVFSHLSHHYRIKKNVLLYLKKRKYIP